MSTRTVAPFGSWRSPISAQQVASSARALSEVRVGSHGTYWLETRPEEGGRQVILHRDSAGEIGELTPPGFNVRTRVHEYGGGSYAVHGKSVYFCNYEDQRVYRQDAGELPRAITPEPSMPAGLRYADFEVAPDGRSLICVEEDHTGPGSQAVNRLVRLTVDGGKAPEIVASGRDFYAAPRLSPDGTQLAWLEWNHPLMPWDATELLAANINPEGTMGQVRRVAGGGQESILQPEWSPTGDLFFVSDRTGWWNLHRSTAEVTHAVCPLPAEFGSPMWVLGTRQFTFLKDGSIVAVFTQAGVDHLGLLRPGAGSIDRMEIGWSALPPYLAPHTGAVWAIAGSPTEPPSVVRVDIPSGKTQVVYRDPGPTVPAGMISTPESMWFPTGGGERSHGFLYRPVNSEFHAPPGTKPPLLVVIHGGPTSRTTTALSLSVQFWTSRGFAVLDVNHRGSSGFGRPYREKLRGTWGIVDVEDCLRGAQHLAESGLVDPNRMAIRGGSAGGFTTLAALGTAETFRAGASYYGVADLEALARETHKFESHYLDGLLGAYPEAREIYRQRSPLHSADNIRAPVIFFQGLEDVVVPPSQAEAMVTALRRTKTPLAYLTFAGEQHGFRRAETRIRCLEAELYFYGRVFGFEPADELDPIPIENL